MSDRPRCLHCKARVASKWRRGLCYGCNADPAIRKQYPKSKFAPTGEPTEEELEATIAEQRKKLPKWWANAMPRGEVYSKPSEALIRELQSRRMRVAARVDH